MLQPSLDLHFLQKNCYAFILPFILPNKINCLVFSDAASWKQIVVGRIVYILLLAPKYNFSQACISISFCCVFIKIATLYSYGSEES